ncbi:precorrin-2 C(20)-methyltransferase [Holophaga foetida]|uniref:precorrin-2 C(20)-methyltransferase n=1 Tax=Holophaga foetida TaxID=35839 RepID=UPI0002471CF2|nr:precorrin-2 C(20)-methyltransferase [Holophaga foetida]
MIMQPEKGHFYAVGVGPGAPDLITLRAARLIEDCDVVVAPRSNRSEESLALKIAAAHIKGQEVLEQVYPMVRDQEKTRAVWAEVADWILLRLEAGKSVVQITLGDPLIYSTSAYLLEALAARVSSDRLHIVPGISAMQAAAASFGLPLTLQEDRLTLMPATDLEAVSEALDRSETLALYKVGGGLPALRELLKSKGLLECSRLAYAVEQEGREQLFSDLDDVDASLGYMSAVLVHKAHKPWIA